MGLNWLFEQYKVPIYHFCKSMLKIPELAEEVTADVFIKIWEKRSLINSEQSIRPFLYKIARDTTYTYLRKIASDERLRGKFLENYPIIDLENGETIFIKKEYASEVDHIIEGLPPQRKLIFRKRYFEGKDNPTIAQELQLSVHTVKSQLVKARGYVRQKLENMDPATSLYSLMILSLFLGNS
ncbi:MAG: sigma-70 family RNA polymerase sigma factor [Bacteroidia bacterium]|nr:sigma-70 family RNA polymerase sigma factor [Bacteroidia bacterium]